MRQIFARLGTPDAISWISVLAVCAQQIVGAFAAPMVDVAGRWVEFLAIRLVALATFVAIMGVGKLLLLRCARRRPQPWITLGAVVVGGVVDVLTVMALLDLADFEGGADFWRRFAISIPGKFTIAIISGLLVTYARELSRRNHLLAATAEELVRTRSDAEERIERRREELTETIRQKISDELSQVSSDDPTEMSRNMKQIVDDVVRPMSYRLSHEFASEGAEIRVVPNPRISWSQIARRALFCNPVYPLTTTVWLSALILVFLSTGYGLRGLAGAAVFGIPLLGLLYLWWYLWRHVPGRWSVRVRAVLFSLALIVTFAGLSPGMELASGYGFTSPSVLIGWVALAVSMTWTITLVFAVNALLRETNRQLESAVDELRREVIALNNRFRLLQKGISRVLHGPIQEAITASIYRLQAHASVADQGLLKDEARRRIDTAVTLLGKPTESAPNLMTVLSELVELWEDVATIDVSVEASDSDRIQTDPLAVNALAELIREACGNAMRHGGATQIHVTLTVKDVDNSVHLTIENNGAPLTADAAPGLGSQIFDEMCLDWSRAQVDDVVRVAARIPLDTGR